MFDFSRFKIYMNYTIYGVLYKYLSLIHIQMCIRDRYRGPEVILGSKYNTTADLWSLACMTFQMLTGDLLFNPKRDTN